MWKKILIVILVIILSLGAGFGVGTLKQHLGDTDNNTEQKYVGKTLTTGDNIANLHVDESDVSDVIVSLPKNTLMKCISYSGKWFLVRLDDGTEGYIEAKYIAVYKEEGEGEEKDAAKASEAANGNYMEAAGEFVFIRSDMSTDSKINGVVYGGDVVSAVVASDTSWYSIQTADGIEGYSSAALLKASSAKKLSSKTIPYVTITGTKANLRSDASTSSSLVVEKRQGDRVQYVQTQTNSANETWYEVLVDGSIAYVRSDLASIQ